MKEQYKKSKETRLRNNPNAYSEMGRKGGLKSESWLKGNSEYMSELAKKGWAKRKMELKGLEDANDIKEEMEREHN